MKRQKETVTSPQSEIDTFENPAPQNNYWIKMNCPEFTCVCPLTGQPDFAKIHIDYVPDKLCVELKSLKLYLWSFRDRGVFHEAVSNEIAEHLFEKLKPRAMVITGEFMVRGGITTDVIISKGSPEKYFGR